jgi:PPM family protein phosphatase
MRFISNFFSEAGPRAVNEDSVGTKFFGGTNLAVAVADGLGGHAGGRVASHLAVDMFLKLATEAPLSLKEIGERIHLEIRSEQQKNPAQRAMATTLSAVVLRPGLAEFVHCGDSRIMLARNNGIRRLTTDHSEVERLFAAGLISKEQRINYPRKNILESALGISGEPTIEVGSVPLMLGDKLFLSTDGFHNKIFLRELFKFAGDAKGLDGLLKLLAFEMKARSPDDNYTVANVFVVS